MGTVRREERAEIVNDATTGGATVQTGKSDPVLTSAHETETYTSDPYAGRRERASAFQRAIYLLFGILEGLLAIRFALSLLGANAEAGFARFVYGITRPFIAPFVGLFATPSFGSSVFEWNALVAIVVYALIAWALVKAVGLVMGDTRRGVRTTSSHIDTNTR